MAKFTSMAKQLVTTPSNLEKQIEECGERMKKLDTRFAELKSQKKRKLAPHKRLEAARELKLIADLKKSVASEVKSLSEQLKTANESSASKPSKPAFTIGKAPEKDAEKELRDIHRKLRLIEMQVEKEKSKVEKIEQSESVMKLKRMNKQIEELKGEKKSVYTKMKTIMKTYDRIQAMNMINSIDMKMKPLEKDIKVVEKGEKKNLKALEHSKAKVTQLLKEGKALSKKLNSLKWRK